MDMISAVIIDDETASRELLSMMLMNSFPQVSVVGTGSNVSSAIDIIKLKKPNLILMDINLGDGDAFQVLQELKGEDFRVIFVTAYNEFAMQAIKFSAIDYILKPVDEEEFKRGVEKAIKEIGENQSPQVNAFLENMRTLQGKDKKVVLKTSDSIFIVSINTIIRCASDYSYTTFYLTSGETIVVSKTLKDIEDLLGNYGFIRVQQSHLVNLQYVAQFSKREGSMLIMSDGSKIPVPQRRRQFIVDYFGKHNKLK
ncbi:MAG: LytTR family DNA-binding domain-containing protein [Bacteroidota bacterium]|nr:LytTR family DNA-binding domain-containing protein [Bacteroidota bacterium]